ncbi:MAG: DUF7507 domain-containing protein [Methanotrichaceae archaeon]
MIAPGIEVVKTASLDGTCPGSDTLDVDIGDTVTFCFNVTNTGDVTLTEITVSDDVYGSVSLGTTSLAPGESTVGTITHIVVESDVLSVTDTATATGTDPLEGTVTDTDDSTVNVSIAPGIDIEKSLVNTPSEVFIGDTVTFEINITNTGESKIVTLPLIDDYPEAYLLPWDSSPLWDSDNGSALQWNNLITTPLDPGDSITVSVDFIAIDTASPAVNWAKVIGAVDEFGIELDPVEDDAEVTIKVPGHLVCSDFGPDLICE